MRLEQNFHNFCKMNKCVSLFKKRRFGAWLRQKKFDLNLINAFSLHKIIDFLFSYEIQEGEKTFLRGVINSENPYELNDTECLFRLMQWTKTLTIIISKMRLVIAMTPNPRGLLKNFKTSLQFNSASSM